MKERRELKRIEGEALTHNEISEIIENGNIEEVFNRAYIRGEPTTIKVGRDIILQSEINRDLFSELEEKESGNLLIAGLEKKITELDFEAFTLAIATILYNQSYRAGNDDINSGIVRDVATGITSSTGVKYHNGTIFATQNELCLRAYGTEPTTENKRKIEATIKALNDTPVKITYPNGDIVKAKLCVNLNTFIRKSDNAVMYHLIVNPIFGSRIQVQFGVLPQDAVKRLSAVTKQKTTAHYILMKWLSVQDNRKPHTLGIDELVKKLRLENFYKVQRIKTEKKILLVCDDFVKTGQLVKYDITKTTGRGGKERIKSITFYLNKDFAKSNKNIMIEGNYIEE